MTLDPSSSVMDSDGSVVDTSTSPTTPDGSLSFSPEIQAAHLLNAFYDGASDSAAETPIENSALPLASVADGVTGRVVKTICCVGAGYVGGPTSAVIAFHNPSIRVHVVDKDHNRIRRWNSKHLPIYEPGLAEIVRIARDGFQSLSTTSQSPRSTTADLASTQVDSEVDDGEQTKLAVVRPPNLVFSTEVARHIKEADIILLTVNTPTKTRGLGAGCATDMTALEGAVREIAIHAKAGAIVVEKSTVPCRTAALIQQTLQMHRPGIQFHVLSNPEFLSEGTAIADLLHPDRVIIGSTSSIAGRQAAAALAEVYAAWIPRTKLVTVNTWSAELSKLVANAILAQRISSINSISAICERTGADIDEVALSIGLDPRIGPRYLKAGLGFGGSCFKKDILSLVYLAESLALPEVGEYWKQVLRLNDFQRDRFVTRAITCLNGTLVHKKITILGFAFKKNTSDTRESPAVDVIRTLVREGPAEIAIYDPCCHPDSIRHEIQRLLGPASGPLFLPDGPIQTYTQAYEACSNASAILILTDWDEFRNVAAARSPASLLSRSTGPSIDDDDHHHHRPSSPVVTVGGLAAADRCGPEPRCALDCPDCRRPGGGGSVWTGERLDWARISYGMRTPKWVFDGRGVLHVAGMEKLGVRVEGIGKVGMGMGGG